jgi:hypothetical protein
MVAKSLFSLINISLNIFTAEIYPTKIRSIAYGFTSFASRFGGILMP